MAWTYSGNPAESELNKYRFLIGDTVASEPLMQDEEINFVLDTYPSHNARLYRLYDALANKFSREDIKKSLGPQSVDPTERKKHFEEQAAFYKRLASVSNISLPKYKGEKAFSKGMMDNA